MKINEIDFASEVGAATVTKKEIDNAHYLFDIDGYNIYEIKVDPYIFYTILDDNKKLLAFIGCGPEINGYISLERIENPSRIPALATMIISRLVADGMKFVIKDTEPLTLSGIEWLCRLIKHNGFGMTLRDQTGKFPDLETVKSEWFNSYSLYKKGPTQIFIENKNLDVNMIIENSEKFKAQSSLFKPTSRYRNNKSLL